MSQYLDGFVLTIKRANLAAYKKLATGAGKIWREHSSHENEPTKIDSAPCSGMCGRARARC